MSVSLYRYTEDCDGVLCPGDCDVCNVGEEETRKPYCPNCGTKMDEEKE